MVERARGDVGRDGGESRHVCAGVAAQSQRIVGGEQGSGLMDWVLNQMQIMVRLAAASNLSAALRSERIWPAREGMYRKALARADSRHWEACLAEAALIDRLSKGRGSGDPWLQL